MKFYGQAQELAAKIIDAFETGNVIEPLATIFLHRKDDKPMNQWSVANQLLCLFSLCTDARGFKQWQQVDRKVKKGEKAQAYILVPLKTKKEDEKTGDMIPIVYGFKGQAVFDIEQTEGEPLTDDEHPHQELINNLPLLNVAQHWGIKVDTYNGQNSGARGYYSFGQKGEMIGLGVENTNTWLHELMHAADNKTGNLKIAEPKWIKETVAQFGASVLAHMIGRDDIADEGKTWRYVKSYSEAAGLSTIQACFAALNRTAEAINLILETAEESMTDLTPAEIDELLNA